MPFENNTILILGAGSSENFPLGSGLVRDIISNDRIADSSFLSENGITASNYLEFVKHLRNYDPSSVDHYLERNTDKINVGRYAIAHSLMIKEDPENLFPPKSSIGNWYHVLGNYLEADTDSFFTNKLTIFTFNYERSLEYYLLKIVQERRRVDEDEAALLLSRIPIYYLHGNLGSLNGADKNYREYKPIVTPQTLKTAAESIRIIFEQSDEYGCQLQLNQAIKNAEKIFIFGFGYHPTNMRRLMNAGLREKLKSKELIKVIPLRNGIEEVKWKSILQDQFENLLEVTNSSSPLRIQRYLHAFGFDETGR